MSRADRYYALTRRPLTPLNLATSAKYLECQSNGGHIVSGRTIDREFPQGIRRLRLCDRCGVPIHAPSGYWGDTSKAKKGGQRT